jgi:hypothetical protein
MALGPLLALPLARFPTLRFAGLTFDHVRAAALAVLLLPCLFRTPLLPRPAAGMRTHLLLLVWVEAAHLLMCALRLG